MLIKKSSFRALILDFDGVSVDTEPFHFEAFRRTLRPIGIELPDDYIFRLVGDPVRKNFEDIARDFNQNLDVDRYIQLREKAYLDILTSEPFGAKPGVWSMIDFAKTAGWKVGLCTSSPKHQVQFLINKIIRHDGKHHPPDRLFDAMVTVEDVRHTKPHPQPYLLCVERLQIPSAQCLAVEDSLPGIQSAKAAGCACIGLRDFYNHHLDFSLADGTVESLEDISLG